MKPNTKKLIITIINIVIFIGNAIISQLGNSADTTEIATTTSAVLTTIAYIT